MNFAIAVWVLSEWNFELIGSLTCEISSVHQTDEWLLVLGRLVRILENYLAEVNKMHPMRISI